MHEGGVRRGVRTLQQQQASRAAPQRRVRVCERTSQDNPVLRRQPVSHTPTSVRASATPLRILHGLSLPSSKYHRTPSPTPIVFCLVWANTYNPPSPPPASCSPPLQRHLPCRQCVRARPQVGHAACAGQLQQRPQHLLAQAGAVGPVGAQQPAEGGKEEEEEAGEEEEEEEEGWGSLESVGDEARGVEEEGRRGAALPYQWEVAVKP